MEPLYSLGAAVGAQLKTRGETIAVSESSAGGLISAALLAAPGASAWYRGGGVIYTGQAFKSLLGLTRADLGDRRSSSEPYARLLAGTIREKLQADWGLCETGAAGPTGNGYGDPAGHACLAVSGVLDGAPYEAARTLRTGSSDRAENMRRFAEAALSLLRDTLA